MRERRRALIEKEGEKQNKNRPTNKTDSKQKRDGVANSNQNCLPFNSTATTASASAAGGPQFPSSAAPLPDFVSAVRIGIDIARGLAARARAPVHVVHLPHADVVAAVGVFIGRVRIAAGFVADDATAAILRPITVESGGNANAANENTNESFDVGVWQINSMNWASCSGGNPPCDPNTNGACAHAVWTWGQSTWNLWSTCGQCGCCQSP